LANPEHFARLKEGGDAWNAWRSQTTIGADLSGADLAGANLRATDLHGIDLCQANLRGAHLYGANLSGTELRGACLSQANLAEAGLIRADLSNADLGDANLSGVNLSGAILTRADLHGANLLRASLVRASLQGANLREAYLYEARLDEANLHSADARGADFTYAGVNATNWGAIDLSGVEGLEHVRHIAASSVGLDTFRRSEGHIPAAFLRGCGLADWEIESAKLYDPSLRDDQRTVIVYEMLRSQLRQPIMFHSLFISYSESDREFASKLHDDLQRVGVRCWFAPHDMASGQKIHDQIDRAIQVQDRLLLILSEASMSSEWVKTELANARAKEREQKRQVLFPIRLAPFEEIRKWKAFDADTGKDSAREVREYFIPDFSNWKDPKAYKPAFERLLKDLRARDEDRRD
jgi:hypothetical protein